MCFKWFRERQWRNMCQSVKPSLDDNKAKCVSDPDRAKRELDNVKDALAYLEAQVAVAGLVLSTRHKPKPKGSQ